MEQIIDIRCDVASFQRELAKIPGITEDQARAAVDALQAEFGRRQAAVAQLDPEDRAEQLELFFLRALGERHPVLSEQELALLVAWQQSLATLDHLSDADLEAYVAEASERKIP